MAKLSWLSASTLPESEYLSTPSFGINRALGGKGIHAGRITVLWGPKASGKTTMALYLIAQAQREGKTCAFVDAEKTFSKEWAIRCGVDVDRLLIVSVNEAEQLLELLIPDLSSGKIDLVVLDSIQSINYGSFFDKPESNGGMGSYSRSAKLVTHKILQALNHNQHAIYISHAAMDLSGMYPVQKAAIGSALEHWASVIIKVLKIKAKDSIREDGSFKVKWVIDKSKQSNYPIEGYYYFDPANATIDNIEEIVTAAKNAEIITGSSWLKYKEGTDEEQKWHGANNLVLHLRQDKELLNALMEELNEIGVEAIEEE